MAKKPGWTVTDNRGIGFFYTGTPDNQKSWLELNIKMAEEAGNFESAQEFRAQLALFENLPERKESPNEV
jgi:Tfp pilus assembly protein PilF